MIKYKKLNFFSKYKEEVWGNLINNIKKIKKNELSQKILVKFKENLLEFKNFYNKLKIKYYFFMKKRFFFKFNFLKRRKLNYFKNIYPLKKNINNNYKKYNWLLELNKIKFQIYNKNNFFDLFNNIFNFFFILKKKLIKFLKLKKNYLNQKSCFFVYFDMINLNLNLKFKEFKNQIYFKIMKYENFKNTFFYNVHIIKPKKQKDRRNFFIINKIYWKKISLFYGFKKPNKFIKIYYNKFLLKYNTIYDYLFLLERRLEIFLSRINFLSSIYFIKQFILNKKVLVNNASVFYINYLINIKDIITIERKIFKWVYKNFKFRLKKKFIFLNNPRYIEVDYKLLCAIFIKKPEYKWLTKPFDIEKIPDLI